MDTAELYRGFADREARGESPTYERLARSVASSRDVLDLIARLPTDKQQPNLVLGAARRLGAPLLDPAAFNAWTVDHWPAVESVLRARSTQTNEAGRLSVLMPVMASLDQPLALLEVGASAGLCLYPDRWRYDYGDAVVGDDGHPTISSRTSGAWTPPARTPEVVWRAGIDLNPLDVTDSDDMDWLRDLVWPEQVARSQRLEAAIAVARSDPPLVVQGDLVERTAELALQAPAGATLVVFHSAVLSYCDADTRELFGEAVSSLPGHWIANESPGALPFDVDSVLPAASEVTRFLTCLDGVPVAWAGPHGQDVEWLGATVDDPAGAT